RVVTARAVALQRHVVRQRLGVRRRSLRMRRGERVRAGLLEQAARGRAADVRSVYRHRDRAGSARGLGSRTVEAAGLGRAAEAGLWIRQDVRKARTDRAEIDALRLARVEAVLPRGVIAHRGVEDR